MQLASEEPPAFTLYIYIYMNMIPVPGPVAPPLPPNGMVPYSLT